jgi:hypothetical protein
VPTPILNIVCPEGLTSVLLTFHSPNATSCSFVMLRVSLFLYPSFSMSSSNFSTGEPLIILSIFSSRTSSAAIARLVSLVILLPNPFSAASARFLSAVTAEIPGKAQRITEHGKEEEKCPGVSGSQRFLQRYGAE